MSGNYRIAGKAVIWEEEVLYVRLSCTDLARSPSTPFPSRGWAGLTFPDEDLGAWGKLLEEEKQLGFISKPHSCWSKDLPGNGGGGTGGRARIPTWVGWVQHLPGLLAHDDHSRAHSWVGRQPLRSRRRGEPGNGGHIHSPWAILGPPCRGLWTNQLQS